jgi:hypothetical protein
MDLNEIDLEFMELEPEERVTQREALFMGLPSDFDQPDLDANALMLQALD